MTTAEDMVREKGGSLIEVSPEATVTQALQVMVDNKVGAVLISEGGRPIGIWTERDLMRNVLTPGFVAREARVGDHMVSPIRSARHTDTAYNLMDKFLGLRLRHLPIEKDGEYIGMVSVGDVMKASLVEKNLELKSLNAAMGWEYYEEWRWTSLAQDQEEAQKELGRPKEDITR